MGSLLLLTGCLKDESSLRTDYASFSATDEKAIGKAIDQAFLNYADTATNFSIYARQQYPSLYTKLDDLLAKALQTDNLVHKDDFEWTIRVIDAPQKEHIMAASGGYLYITKDMLNLLDAEAEFFVLLCEVLVGIDEGFVTKQLEQQFSIPYLEDLSLGGTVEDELVLVEAIRNMQHEASDVSNMEENAKDMACAAGYDLSVYADWVHQTQQNSVSHLEWFEAYPLQEEDLNALYQESNSTMCTGSFVGRAEYDALKALL